MNKELLKWYINKPNTYYTDFVRKYDINENL